MAGSEFTGEISEGSRKEADKILYFGSGTSGGRKNCGKRDDR
jgi:hypothetical protein